MKTTMKRRLVSALLAIAMVASFLPAGLIPEAKAITFSTATLDVRSDGSFEAIFKASGIAADLFDSGHYFLLVPNIKVAGYPYTPEELFTNSETDPNTQINLGLFQKLLQDNCGIDAYDKTSGCLFLGNTEIPSTTISSGYDSVTITHNTNGIGKLPSTDKIVAKYGEGIKGENGIPYIAILYTEADPATIKPTNIDYYAATGLVADPDHIDIVYNDDAWRQYKKPKPSPCDPYWEVNGTNQGADTTYAEIVITNLGSDPVNIVDVYFEEESFSELVDPSQENVEVGEDGPWFFTREDWDYVNGPDEPTASDNYGPVEVTDSITLLVDMYAAAEAQLSTTEGTGTGTLVIAYGTASNPTPLRVPFTMKRLSGYTGDGTVELHKDGSLWNDGVGTLPTITLNGPAGGGGIGGSGTDTVTFADLNEGTYDVWVNGTDCGKDITIAESDTGAAKTVLNYYTYELKTADPKAGSVNDGRVPPVAYGIYPVDPTAKAIAPRATANSGYTFDHWEDEAGSPVTAPTSLTKRTVLTAHFTSGTLSWKTTPSSINKISVVYESNDAKSLSLPWVAESFAGDTIDYAVSRNDLEGTPTYVTVTGKGVSGGVTMTANGTPIPVGKYTITVTAHSQTYDTTITNTLEVEVTKDKWPPVHLTKKTDVTTKGGTEGSFQIEDYDSGYTYEFSSDGGTTWTAAPSTWNISNTGLVTVVTEGTYRARIKEDANHDTDSSGTSATIEGPSKGWANVTVNLNGNAWHTVTGAGTLPTVTLEKGGSSFTATTVADSVYSFDSLSAGTYTVKAGGVDVPGVTVTVVAGETVTATVNYYTVTFNANNGALSAGGTTSSANVISGLTTPVPGVAARGGYTFGGWATTANGTTAELSATATVTGAITGKKDYYAIWTVNELRYTPKPLTATVGDDLGNSSAHANAHDAGQLTMVGLPSATFTISNIVGLPAGLTLEQGSTVGNIRIFGTPTAATTGAVAVTFDAKCSETNVTETFTVNVTINKKPLIDPTLTHVQDLTMAGADDGKLTFTLPSGDDTWPTGAVETTYKLQTSTSQSGTYTDVKNVTPGTIDNLAPGWYKVVATLKDSDNYTWASGNDGVTNSVEIKDKGINAPTVTQSQTFEKNSNVRTATSVSFKYTTGDWTRVTGVKVDGKSVAFTDNGTDTVTIACTALDALSLTNGTKSVELTFARDSVDPLEKTASADLLNVQTTYRVTFDKNVPAGATPPTANPSIANKVVTDGNGASFPYSGTGGIQNNFSNTSIPGYTFDGWNTAANGSGTRWVTGNYTPADTAATWDSTVYAQWTANKPTVTTHNITGVYGSDQLKPDNAAASASPVVAAVVTSGKTGDTYDYKLTGGTVPAGLTISWGGKTTVGTSGNYESGTGTVTISGKPRVVNPGAAVTIQFTATSKTNGESVNGTFTIEIAKATPTITVGYQTTSLKDPATGSNYTVNKSKTNTFVGDLTTSAATVTTVSGPYWDPTKSGDDKWVTLGRDTAGMSWTLAPGNLTSTSNSVTGTLAYAPGGTAVTLTDFWTTDKGTGTIEATATYEVTVQVRHNGSTTSTSSSGTLGADLRDGSAVLFTRSGYSSNSGGVTYAISSTGHNVKVKVPSGTGYTVAVGNDQRTSISVSGNTTIYFDYYDVNYATRSMSNDHGEYGTSSSHTTTATSGLVLVAANDAASTTKTWVDLPGTVADTNYDLQKWESTGTGSFKNAVSGGGTTVSGDGTTGTRTAKSWVVGSHTGTGAITLTPTFYATGANPKVTIRVNNATDTAGDSDVTKVELWSQGTTPALVYTAPTTGVATFTGGVATFTNITAGTYHIYVNNGTRSVDSGVDLNTADANTNVDFYRVRFTTPATQKHYADSWSNTIGADKAVTATATVFGTANTALNNNDPVLKGTVVAFEVADWASADYALTWAVATAGTGRTASYTVNGTMANPVVATLTQNVYPVTGKTDKTTHGGSFDHVTNVKYAVTRTGGDGTTLATLSPTYNKTNGQFTTPATGLTGSAGKLPAGFTYALTASTSDDTKTIIREYKEGAGGTPVAYPGPLSFSVTTAGGNTQPEPWIVLEGAVFSFVLSNDYVDKDNYTEATGRDWGSVVFGYPQPALQTVTIVNTGNRPLEHVTVAPMPGSGFVAKDLSATTIPVGGTATFTVQPVTGLRVNGGTPHTQRYTVSADYASNKTYDAKLTVTPAEMDYATVAIDRPVEGNTPATSASITDEYAVAGSYSVESITWGVVGGGTMPATFQAGGQYQVTLVLNPDGDHIFVDESQNHPAPNTVAYKVNGAVYNGTGTDGGRLITRTVNNTTHKVTLVYQFTTLQAGLPAPSMVPLTYERGKLTQITATSSDEVNFYYVILPDGETAPSATAIYDAATDPTNKPVTNQVISGVAPSGTSSGNKVTWNAGQVFNGDPGKTYNVYVVARPKTGGDLTEVNTTSVTLPKKLTITIKKVGSTTTVKGPAYPTVNSTTGADITGNLTLNSSVTTTNPALSMRGAYTFTASPDLISETSGLGYNISGAWALKQVEIRRGATDAAATAATGTDKDVRNLANIDYGWAAPVTQIDVTFRQRIVNQPIISGNPTLGSTLTATVGSGNSQVTIGDTKVTTFDGTDPNFGSDLLYQWQWNDGGTWRDITGATAYQWTVTPEHSGHSFRVMVTYDREEDRGISGRGSTVASDPTATRDQKLDAPVVHLYKVENSADDATPAGVTLTDKDEGGLYLVVEPVAHEELSGTGTTATYEVTLTGGAIAAAGLKVTIDPSAADVQKDASGNYWYRWSANWDNVRPGNNGSSNNTFTASVKAVVPTGTTGWTSSDAGTATSLAGRRVLKQTDLTGKFDDRVFNGAAQTGLPSNAATISNPTRIPTPTPSNGHIHTIADLFQGDKTGAVGAISIQYANNAAGDTKAGTKTNVNMTEATTTPPETWDPANKHDYYSYVTVAQGGLYLKLDQFAFNLNGQDSDWKITQAPTQIRDLVSKTTEQNVAVDLSTSNPKVRYQAANGSWVGTYPGQTGDYVTSQFDFTYAVTGWSSGTPVAGTNYTLAADGKTFTPISTGTFTITVTAKYKGSTAPQFKADLAEPPTATFTVGGQMGDFTALQVETTRREATYGDAASAVSNPTTTATWYVTTDTNGAPDNNQAKYFSLEGIKVTETWSNGNQTYDLSTLEPENITGITGGGVAEKGADGILRIKFPDANGNQRQVTFKVKNTHPAKNGPGGTGNVTQTSTNTVTLILKARPLPYEIQATNSTATTPDDWTVKAEKLWNNDVTLNPGGDKARNGTPLRIQTVVDDPFAQKDNVTINPNGYKSRNPANTADDSTVGQDRVVVAKNAQPSGSLARFYRTGTATNSVIDIYPAHINPMEVEIDKPSTITVNDANLKSKVGVRVKQKNDESNKGGGNVTLVPGTKIEWEKWNTTTSAWEADTSPIFQIDSLYRATVALKADTNHYFREDEGDKFYNVNGFYNGDYAYLDPEWKKEASKVYVIADDTAVIHPDLKVLHNNKLTISLVFDTSETPELRYSDGIGVNNDADYHHNPNKYVTHTEDVTIGDVTSDLVFTINLDAFTRPIYGVSVAITDNNLTRQDGVTLVPTRPEANPSTSRTEMKLAGYKADPTKPGDRDYDMDLDRISYTLTIPQALANTKGTYTLTLQARGASSQANVEANRYDVADNRYTFVLVVRDKPQTIPGGPSGTTVIEDYNVSYWLSSVGTSDDPIGEHVAPNKTPQNVPTVTALNGYTFLGWSLDNPAKVAEPKLVDPKTVKITEDTTFYAVYKAPAYDHSHYVIGFPDGTFGPDSNITRGQVATIIARACLDDFREGANYGNPGGYSDVDKHWASSAIAYCSINNVFNGYEDGTFRPDDAISRQELATAVARLGEIQPSAGMPFTDSADVAAWAQDTVYTAYANGWIQGYEDGTFLPENDIKRSETVKIFNGYLERTVNQEGLSDLHEYVHSGVASNLQEGDKAYMTWPDVPATHWAYYEIIEAANDHNYHRTDEADPKSTEMWETARIDEIWRYHDDLEDGASRVDDLMNGTRLTEAEARAKAEEEARIKAEEEARLKAEAEAKAAEEAAKAAEEAAKAAEEAAKAENQPTDQPTDVTTPPADDTVGGEGEGEPTGETTPPAEESTPPTEETTPPTEETTPPTEETTPPVEETTPPIEEGNPSETMIHRAYINGFEDSTFRPDDAITRAAVASVIARTLLESYDPELIYDTELVDLEGHWAKNYVAFCEQSGVFGGYEDGTFRPDQGISRQEFAVVLARLSELTGEGELTFTDSADVADWAASGVTAAVDKGWLKGYEDGTFLPEKLITRAEAVKLFNSFLGRGVNYNGLSGVTGGSIWSDVSPTHWAYLEIVEAANDHTFHWNDADDPIPPERWETAGEI